MRMTAGTYRHYKGNEYEAFCLARDANGAGEIYVLYRKLYGDRSFWIRPRDMFFEDVEVDGAFTPRFARTGEPEDCEKKIDELKAIASESGAPLRIRHSETMAVYTLAGFEADGTGAVPITPADD